jgi:hypothetical protein
VSTLPSIVLKSFSIDRTDSKSSLIWIPFKTTSDMDCSLLRLLNIMDLMSSVSFCIERTICVMRPKLVRIERSRFLVNHMSGVFSLPTCSGTLSTISHDLETYSTTFLVIPKMSFTSSHSSPLLLGEHDSKKHHAKTLLTYMTINSLSDYVFYTRAVLTRRALELKRLNTESIDRTKRRHNGAIIDYFCYYKCLDRRKFGGKQQLDYFYFSLSRFVEFIIFFSSVNKIITIFVSAAIYGNNNRRTTAAVQ